MCNPHSDDPAMALHPSAFPGSAGSRLFKMVRDVDHTVSEAAYLERLELRNLVLEPEWSRARAAVEARVTSDYLKGRVVVVLGSTLPPLLGWTRGFKWYVWQLWETTAYVVVPHPSGLSRVYNESSYRVQTGQLLARLVKEGRS